MVDVSSERQELDAMVERLVRSPRLAHLLRYIGDRYFSGEISSLREFEIATEVFGRSSDFDPSADAIARVEAHRLRKKLKLYYETEGRGNAVRITIPSGTYTPLFTHQGLDAEVVSEPMQTPFELPPAAVPERPVTAPDPPGLGRWLWLVLPAVGVLVLATVWVSRSNFRTVKATAETGAVSNVTPAGNAAGNDGAIRIAAGYTGQPHIGPGGNAWKSDEFFIRGGTWPGSSGFTARTDDPFLYRMMRTGEFEYSIPLKPGSYELHLFFSEASFGPGIGGGEGSRSFNIVVNHQVAISDFDIESDANGPNIADERVIRDVGPDTDGHLHIELEGVSGKPLINAIEILPGLPRKQLPIRITAQSNRFMDHLGNVWYPDNYYLGGQPSLPKPPVKGTPDPGLFTMERYGHFSYALPVDRRGSYTLTLYFAEFYFGTDMAGFGGVGSRVFNVFCNGTVLLRDFDILKEAGPMHALAKTFRHLKPSAQGKLTLTFEPVANYANISAIEVLDESQ